MQRLEVHKFGGTSLGDAPRIVRAAELLGAGEPGRLVAVASAMAGVTDLLIEAAHEAAAGRREPALEILERIGERHDAALAELGRAEPVTRAELQAIVGETGDLLRAVVVLGELTPRVRDRIVAAGEKLSARLLAQALRARGRPASAVDADGFLETDERFGEATPIPGVAERAIESALRPRLLAGVLPVVTGFCGRTSEGRTTTLGRGGSDFSATLIGAALGAGEVVIWTDVDGVFSADPRIVPEARRIEQLHYREAAELSYYGAKVLHPRTIQPVAARGIPVRIRNSFAPAEPGSLVDGRFTPGSHPVKAISAIRAQALVSLEGKGMSGVPGIAARVFRALAERRISVTMISQSSSESSICLALPETDALAAEVALKREFRLDIAHGDIEELAVQPGIGLVAAVGLGMAHTPGVAARVFAALARRRVNVVAIAQGSSELNISLALDEAEVDTAVRAIHEEFGLHRTDTGADDADGLDLLLLGSGRVARAFAELVQSRRAHVAERFGLRVRVVALADRTGYLFHPRGLERERLAEAFAAKARGQGLAAQPGGVAADSPAALLRHALAFRLSRPVLVDLSDHAGALEILLEALERGADVVTANKHALAGSYRGYAALRERERATGRILRAEATVGAGLPVIDTLEMLLATGDELTRAEGSLSGTLGHVMTGLGEGLRFSEAVADAVRRGYTEPDPVADLSGADVARKALILGRVAGLFAGEVPLRLEGLVDPALAGLSRDELFARLAELDEPFAARVAAARADGSVLRYAAAIDRDGVRVGPVVLPADSPLGRLTGTDNTIVFHSERYRERPLVVTGPGAGVEVTAMGVLGDVLRIAAERR